MFSKNSYLKSKLRVAAVMLLSVIMALSLFFAAACSDDETETEKTTTSNDTQTILNGNFEFFSDSDDGTYIIYTPNNWSSATSGNTNYVMNGIVDTSDNGWAKLTDPELAATLDYNNSLDEDDDDYDDEYVDYNGMKSRDIPYKDTYNSLNSDDYYTLYGNAEDGYYILDSNDSQVTVVYNAESGIYTDDNGNEVNIKSYVDTPLTHNVITAVEGQEYDAYYVADSSDSRINDEDCTVTIEGKTCIKLYADEDGNYFYDSECEDAYESHVLMIHNYVNDDTRYGTAQSYSSSTTVTLQPNTAAELSVWVKTSELIYDRNGNEIYEGRGAYIELEQTVGGSSVDSLFIENIRTDGVTENNGWLKYTIYVTGCDFAESTITLTVGLGQAESSSDYSEACEGYAFFDDVQCTVYSGLDKTTYEQHESAVYSCMLTDEEDEKIFSFDSHSSITTSTDESGAEVSTFAYDAYYYSDLASQADQVKIPFDGTASGIVSTAENKISTTSGTTVDFTRDSDYYITASKTAADSGITGYNLSSTDNYKYSDTNTTSSSDNGYKVNYLTNPIDTSYDVLGMYDLSNLENDINTAATNLGGGYSYYSKTISNVLGSFYGDDYTFEDGTDYSALMILSAYGSAYTATVTDPDHFTVGAQDYKMISFWIKTSDMGDYTAATVSLYAYQYEDGELIKDDSGAALKVIDTNLSSSLSVNTTGVTFDVDNEDDIYNGWVQCFFYVENTTSYPIEFEMQIGFGNTAIADTDSSDYKAGYVAVTNIQTLEDVDEDIFSLASSGTYAASFSLTTSDATENNYFDSTAAVDPNSIKSNITNPSSYTGVNGGSASVVYTETLDNSGIDGRNSSEYAGLINQNYWNDYIDKAIEDKTADSESTAYDWLVTILDYNGLSLNDAINTLYELYGNVFGSTTIQPLLISNYIIRTYGDESTTTAAANYGYIANSSTSVSSDSYEIITVKVYVSAGAVAYVYLTENDGTSSGVMTLNLPEYTFWYDYQGNVLDGEPDYDDDSYSEADHIVYYIRDDGLYEDSNGNLYANLYNYSRLYYDQTATYYEYGAKTATLYEDIDNDTVYYTDTTYTIESPHYLVAYDSDGGYTRVFLYSNKQFEDTAYHYVITETDEDDEDDVTVSYSDGVACFDTSVASVRYDNTDTTSSQMYAVVDARYGYDANGNLSLWAGRTASTAVLSELGYDANGNYVADTWQTVSFYIHTGDTSYDYTLELWSGARDTSGVTKDDSGNYVLTDDASASGTYVAFDLSNMTSDEDTYADLLEELTNEIIDAYVRVLSVSGNLTTTDEDGNTIGVIKDADQNLAYYMNLYDSLVASGKITESDFNTAAGQYYSYYSYWQIINNLKSAQYYTYTLYDDAGYVPFNAETASDSETGYDYSTGDYEETLVFLSYVTGYTTEVKQSDGSTINVYTANYVTFIDYSASDVTVDTTTAEEEEEEEDEDEDSSFSVWLLVASIVLAVVLIFTMISLLIRDIVKKARRRKVNVKNRYSGKRKHYIKKLGLAETVEEPEDSSSGEDNN